MKAIYIFELIIYAIIFIANGFIIYQSILIQRLTKKQRDISKQIMDNQSKMIDNYEKMVENYKSIISQAKNK